MCHPLESRQLEEKDMANRELDWSPRTEFGATIAKIDHNTWGITAVGIQGVRIGFDGRDHDGTVVTTDIGFADAQTEDEGKILIETMRAGSEHLSDWRAQLEAAGFSRSYPDAEEGSLMACVWNDQRDVGTLTIIVKDGYRRHGATDDVATTSVACNYQDDGTDIRDLVCSLTLVPDNAKTYGDVKVRRGVPEGVDVLKVGVAAAIAIRDARLEGDRIAHEASLRDPAHLEAIAALKLACFDPDAIDVSTPEDVADRGIRIRRADGSTLVGQYDKHAEMFAVFVATPTPGMSNADAWLGAIDAPWAERLAA
jgi:hypothetical protein